MANRIEGSKDIIIQFAAWLFVRQTRDAKEIAKTLKVDERTIHRYAETDTWDKTLKRLKYDGERSFRVQKAGRKTTVEQKIIRAKYFLDSANLLERTLNFVIAESPEEAESKLDDTRYGRKVVAHCLYAIVFELSIKIIWDIEKDESAPHHHNISRLYKDLSPDAQQEILNIYKTQVNNIEHIISQCNGQIDSEGKTVNIELKLQSLNEALKANEQTITDFKYGGQFNGKSSALCSVMWTDDLIYALPQGIANAIIFPKTLLEYAISLNN